MDWNEYIIMHTQTNMCQFLHLKSVSVWAKFWNTLPHIKSYFESIAVLKTGGSSS